VLGKPIYALAIIFALLALWGSPSSLNFDGLRVNSESRSVHVGMDALVVAENNYQLKYGSQLTVSQWREDLYRDGVRPPNFSGFLLSYGENSSEGRYFCLTAEFDFSNHARKVLLQSQDRMVDRSGYKVFVSEECGSTANGNINDSGSWDNFTSTVFTGN
jgi:hypothetical protein